MSETGLGAEMESALYDATDQQSPMADRIKKTLAPVFERHNSISAAYLFGSNSNGQSGPMSDIDLAVLLTGWDHLAGADIRLELYADCCRVLQRNDVDIILLNKTRNLFLLAEVMSNGILLYDCDSGLREEFEVMVMHDFIDFREHRMKVMGI
jgi:uncharacterized protein